MTTSRRRRLVLALLTGSLLILLAIGPAAAQAPVVRAILFHSSTCPHCIDVITNILPPIQAKYGARFELRMLEISDKANNDLFTAALKKYAVPQELWAVPLILIGQTYLVGSDQISEKLEQEIDRGLAAGGLDYPALPTVTPGPTSVPKTPTPTPAQLPLGLKGELPTSLLALVLDLGMVVALLAVPLWLWRRGDRLPSPLAPWRPADVPAPSALSARKVARAATPAAKRKGKAKPIAVARALRPGWAILALLLLGLAAAAYLTYVDLTQSQAFCGPLSNCDLVQASPYAKILGVPVAVLGLLGYLGLLVAWLVGRWGPQRFVAPAAWAMVGMAFAGTVFSAYLTFLEPYVIGAVCPWCLTSAVAMTLILLASARFLLSLGATAPRGLGTPPGNK
jgi:uncharacterized membrane protein